MTVLPEVPTCRGLGSHILSMTGLDPERTALRSAGKLLVAGYLVLAADPPAHGEEEIGLGDIDFPLLLFHVFDEGPALDRGHAVDHLSRTRSRQGARMLLEAPASHGEDEGPCLRLELPEDLVGIVAFQEKALLRVEAAHIRDEGQVEVSRRDRRRARSPMTSW